MKKLILFLLLPLWAMAQTSNGQETEFDYGIKNNSTQTITTPPYIGTFGTDGTQGKIPSAYIEKTDNKQNSLAVDGTGTKYPTVDAINAALPKTYTTTVYVNTNDPNTATIFDDENPPTVNDDGLKSNTDNLYIGSDASAWVYNGSTYVTKIVPASSNFYIRGTTVDAGNGKTENIERSGNIKTSGSLESYEVNAGNVIANNFIKSGGTSSQFLKADGSVDATIYEPALGYAPANDSNVVHKTGNESIDGLKSFTNTINIQTNDYTAHGCNILTNEEDSYGINITTNNNYSYGTKITTNGERAYGSTINTNGHAAIAVDIVTMGQSAHGTQIVTYGNNSFGNYIVSRGANSIGNKISLLGASSVGMDISLYNANAGNIIQGIWQNVPRFTVSKEGNVTATSFIKSGGTSSQFLKADGSVDSSVYATTASPTLTGTPTAPTAVPGTNDNTIANAAFVQAANAGNVKTTGDQTIAGIKTFSSGILSNSLSAASSDILTLSAGGTSLAIDDTNSTITAASDIRATNFIRTTSLPGQLLKADGNVTAGYKVYTAILSQIGTNAPTATVLENTLGSVSFAYSATGNFNITIPNAIDLNKIVILIHDVRPNWKTAAYPTSTTNINIKTVLMDSAPPFPLNNSLLLNTPIEIRVYN